MTQTVWILAPAFAAVGGSLAWAEPPARSTANLDGLYVTLGPVGGVTRTEGEWSTDAGAELSLVSVTERRKPAALGVAMGGVGYTERDGGRLWLEAEVAFRDPLPLAVGLGLGSTAEIDPVRPPRFGGQATLWAFLGVVPFVRVGSTQESGPFLELGVMIKVPAIKVFSY